MSVASLLNQVKEGEIVLPSIQRDFVWQQERILRLFDSIMRGYPIGTVLLWETHENIQYRTFLTDFRSANLYTYGDNSLHKKMKLVIDGQQRLQSLYIAVYGTYEGYPLYFDVLSGRERDDVSKEKYVFKFMSQADAQAAQDNVASQLTKHLKNPSSGYEVSNFIKFSDLFAKGAADKERLKNTLSKSLSLNEVDRVRLSTNLSLLDQTMSKDVDVLKETIIDKDLPNGSESRKSEYDVLEIFVRVNTENTRLNRSDLIFSMLKLNWKESATSLPEFIKEINEGNSFDVNNDFVIRCLFAVSNLGTKFDIDLLRKKKNVIKLRANFEQCCNAIRSTIDFVQTHCWCSSSGVIGGLNTLIPFVYYLFHTKNHLVRNNQVAGVRKALFLIGFAKPFSRYGESRVWAFIRDELKPLVENHDETFPWNNVIWWVSYWEKIRSFEDLLQSNHILALHLVQGLTGAEVKYDRNAPEIDHIFPRSVLLRSKEFDQAIINNFANFWILAKTKNQNKSNQHPANYFEDVDESEMKAALIDREYLDYRRYTTFVSNRGQRMVERVKEKLGFQGDEFERSANEET